MSAESNLPPGFDAIRALFCSRPFESSPGVYVRCQSRRRASCPSCAELYRGDWARIARSGIYDPDGHPVVGFRYFFITLSAPSFGAVHRVPKPKDRGRRRCGCGDTHSPDDIDLRGLPLDLNDYDYAGQVSWHVGLGRLWNATVSAMRDRVPDMEFCAVREVQARMALHLHVIVRVPAGNAQVTAESLGVAAREATAAHPVTKEGLGWGQRGVQDREIKPRHLDVPGTMPSESVAAARVVRYVSKALNYSLKDIHPGDPTPPTPARVAFILRLREAARYQVLCPKCTGKAADCPGKGHESLGYSGHTISVSRPTTNRAGWSFSRLTRTVLREQRLAWMEANAPDRVGTGLDDAAKVAADWIRDVFAARIHDDARFQPARAPAS